MKNKLFSLAVVTALGLGFSGCGSSSENTTENETQTGTFVDAPVQGLHYITATQDGYTDENGTFQYIEGETIEFKLGNLSFGNVQAGNMITPYTMAGDTNISNPSDKATNIALLLQNFDGNRSNTQTLDLSNLRDYNFTDIDLNTTVANMEQKVSALLATVEFQQHIDNNHTFINSATVTNVMHNFVLTEQSADIISTETGFGTQWLDGRTLWSTGISDGEKYQYTFLFNNGRNTAQQGLQDTVSTPIFDNPYTIVDGVITVDELGNTRDDDTIKQENDSDRYQRYKIYSIEGSKIITCNDDSPILECSETSDNYQVFFTDKNDAQTYYDSL